MNLDGLLYILGTIPMLIITFLLLLLNFIIYAANGMTALDLVLSVLMYLVPTFLVPILVAVIIMKLDGKPIKPMAKGLICYPIFLGSWIAINVKCLFKQDTTWEKIDHVRDIKINEVTD